MGRVKGVICDLGGNGGLWVGVMVIFGGVGGMIGMMVFMFVDCWLFCCLWFEIYWWFVGE